LLGCAIYVGPLAQAGAAVRARQIRGLAKVPVWFFSSGPTGVPLLPDNDVRDFLRAPTTLEGAK
jgi:hypothetical protein